MGAKAEKKRIADVDRRRKLMQDAERRRNAVLERHGEKIVAIKDAGEARMQQHLDRQAKKSHGLRKPSGFDAESRQQLIDELLAALELKGLQETVADLRDSVGELSDRIEEMTGAKPQAQPKPKD